MMWNINSWSPEELYIFSLIVLLNSADRKLNESFNCILSLLHFTKINFLYDFFYKMFTVSGSVA